MTNALVILNYIYGYSRPFSLTSCPDFYKVCKNISELSSVFDYCFILNDSHQDHNFEFKYLPKHCLENTEDSVMMPSLFSDLKSRHIQTIPKTTLNAFANEHISKTIKNYGFEKICLVGFSASIDILPSIIGSIDIKQDVYTIENALGDLTQDLKNDALKMIRFLGVEIL